jgi:hypothetical protein
MRLVFTDPTFVADLKEHAWRSDGVNYQPRFDESPLGRQRKQRQHKTLAILG